MNTIDIALFITLLVTPEFSPFRTRFISKNVALAVGCQRGSVYLELRRNSFEEQIYCPQYAHQSYLARKRNATKYQIPPELVEFIRLLIEHDWSPEQISCVLTGSRMPVSHE